MLSQSCMSFAGVAFAGIAYLGISALMLGLDAEWFFTACLPLALVSILAMWLALLARVSDSREESWKKHRHNK